ncbi:RFC2 [Symbiodinium necroappetens]|uniref:RFC2 protein n=1 Tax=Symbiodinium necroappetens TaxID=1628268 RepID=A0A812RY45_9DINO|nr:RFC2 [Symbiodinium necroappetens]
MTHDAQAALRRIMEEFVHVTRFIIICNYVSKIIEPLHSRCSKFRFQLVGAEFQKTRLLHICEKEKVAVSPGALEQLIFLSKGDMRCAVTMLQTAVQVYDKVDEDSLVEVFCAVPDSKTRELLARCRSSQTTEQVLEAVRDFLLEGFSGLQVMEQLQELLAEDVSLQDAVKAKCAVLFSQARRVESRSVFEELQLFELFSNLRPLIQDCAASQVQSEPVAPGRKQRRELHSGLGQCRTKVGTSVWGPGCHTTGVTSSGESARIPEAHR